MEFTKLKQDYIDLFGQSKAEDVLSQELAQLRRGYVEIAVSNNTLAPNALIKIFITYVMKTIEHLKAELARQP